MLQREEFIFPDDDDGYPVDNKVNAFFSNRYHLLYINVHHMVSIVLCPNSETGNVGLLNIVLALYIASLLTFALITYVEQNMMYGKDSVIVRKVDDLFM